MHEWLDPSAAQKALEAAGVWNIATLRQQIAGGAELLMRPSTLCRAYATMRGLGIEQETALACIDSIYSLAVQAYRS